MRSYELAAAFSLQIYCRQTPVSGRLATDPEGESDRTSAVRARGLCVHPSVASRQPSVFINFQIRTNQSSIHSFSTRNQTQAPQSRPTERENCLNVQNRPKIAYNHAIAHLPARSRLNSDGWR